MEEVGKIFVKKMSETYHMSLWKLWNAGYKTCYSTFWVRESKRYNVITTTCPMLFVSNNCKTEKEIKHTYDIHVHVYIYLHVH
jgi:hypothetical protein